MYEGILRAEDFADAARSRLDPVIWDYIAGGAGAELTIAGNRAAFDEIRIAPRVLVGVADGDTRAALLGGGLPAPIGIAPTAYQKIVHTDGEVAMAAGAAGHLNVVSFFASSGIEEIAAAATGPLWLQLYWLRRRDVLERMAHRAEAAGYSALMLTADAPRIGRRLRDERNAFAIPDEIRAVNVDAAITASAHDRRPGASAIAVQADQSFDTGITWDDLAWLRGLTSLPLVIKGVLTAHDARLAVEHGAAGIVVSNHGGRQVDGAVATIHALPGIVDAVAGRATVLLDGGVRSGRDVFIALALGADGVLLGRPPLWALATGGTRAVAHLMRMLDGELAHLMALAGRSKIGDIAADALVR